jgi:hypothetical protein
MRQCRWVSRAGRLVDRARLQGDGERNGRTVARGDTKTEAIRATAEVAKKSREPVGVRPLRARTEPTLDLRDYRQA